ncbi:variable large family protein (plasmid) [Borrelia coriaceae]|uniref:Variable large protein n=1 Tax=Borrelia coriaceae ATCC 43381 TaxID=1408429 RepID=W5SXX4_9SPIR|nr:hypothetical protein BCO_0013508 [Borrelia coriaceae ATCC 43381]UPA17153.1 variable large family protein [Borrelia coriaceae]
MRKLSKIIDGASEALKGAGGNEPIANVADTNAGVVGTDIDKLVNGIKSIVDVVLKDIGNASAGDDKKATDLSGRTGGNSTSDESGKLFATDNAGADGKKAAADAAKAVGAVIGADILQAIAKGNEGDAFKCLLLNLSLN